MLSPDQRSASGLGFAAGSLFCLPGKRFLAPAALLVLSSLMACGGAPEVSAPPPPAPAPPAQPAAAPAAASAPSALLAGLTPLPSKQQVLAAAPTDRPDPFAPVIRPQPAGAAAGAASRPAGPVPLTLPEDFRFSGVIAIAGVPQALVQRTEQSGSVVVGDQGGRSTRLIPNGWVVTEIDVHNGRLRMRLGKQTISAALRPT